MTTKTWFLPPDFTFHENGLLRLWTVIPRPDRPMLILLDPGTDTTTPPKIILPEIQALEERNHGHSRSQSSRRRWPNLVEIHRAGVCLHEPGFREPEDAAVRGGGPRSPLVLEDNEPRHS